MYRSSFFALSWCKSTIKNYKRPRELLLNAPIPFHCWFFGRRCIPNCFNKVSFYLYLKDNFLNYLLLISMYLIGNWSLIWPTCKLWNFLGCGVLSLGGLGLRFENRWVGELCWGYWIYFGFAVLWLMSLV